MKKLAIMVVLLIATVVLQHYNIIHTPTTEPYIHYRQEEDLTAEKSINVIPVNLKGEIIRERFGVSQGFVRVPVEKHSFSYFLRNLPLKPHGSKVLYYNGKEKVREVHEAVIDMDIDNRDLQQCADAIMRLMAEYLYGKGEYRRIRFNFTNGFTAEYSKWMKGYRIAVDGYKVKWVKKKGYSNTYKDLREYLNIVFAYAGTLSLAQELVPVDVGGMQIGDVFIQGGSPGQCAIVVDMAENKTTGDRLFMLAQSYMPAQDIHILKNLVDSSISPWYCLDFGDTLVTPEWVFKKGDLKRFPRQDF